VLIYTVVQGGRRVPKNFVYRSYLLCYYNHREVVTDLIDEYKAAERADYVTYGGSGGAQNVPPGAEA
jgi:hypothetical protein